jgi:hypothetical protein
MSEDAKKALVYELVFDILDDGPCFMHQISAPPTLLM